MVANEKWFSGAGATAGFYTHQIEQSVRVDQDSTSYLKRTNGTPTNEDKCTISAWVKRTKIGSHTAYSGGYWSGGNGGGYLTIGMQNVDDFKVLHHPDSNLGTDGHLKSTALFRDTNGWSHFVVAYDSTQSTSSNRLKVYFNGTQISSWTTETYPASGKNFVANTNGSTIFVGSGGNSGGGAYQPFDGYIAEFIMIDGTQYDSSNFGETKNGVWIPKDPSGLTFGNNGFYLKFEDASNLGNDSSSNNNDLTAYNLGTDHQVLDSPTFGS